MHDIPYEPFIRDRSTEQSRAEEIPGYMEARQVAAEDYGLLRELQDVRKRAGLTQKDVALRIGTTPTAISRLEGLASTYPPCQLFVATPTRSIAMW